MSIDLNNSLDDTVISNQEKNFLKNLQANILKGHGREHVALLFLGIKNVAKARDFLHNYTVTDSLTQLEETIKFKAEGTPGGLVRLVFISNLGLNELGHGDKFKNFSAFSAGMAQDNGVLDGGTTASWQNELKKDIHVLLLIAHHDPTTLARTVSNLADKLVEDDSPDKNDSLDKDASPFEIIFVQQGNAYKNADGEGVEHFGYVDGRSQPLMLKSQIEYEKNSRRGGIDQYNPSAPLGQFILKDPLISDGFGSFLVFRKLEQDVAGFKQKESDLSIRLNLIDNDEERAGAMVVGRFEDGTPLVLSDKENGVPVINNFNYDADADGSKCPFHSHIRKTNPRGSSPDKSVQMARRGITYGSRMQHPITKEFIDKPNDGVGLLFMSYQASIENQFQFMQTNWANDEDFPINNVGIDPVIGQDGSIPSTQKQKWCPVYGSMADSKDFLFKGFVKLKGGEYFYTPSISGLKKL